MNIVDIDKDILLQKNRDYLIYVVTGRKAIGKTYTTQLLAKKYVAIHKKKVIVFGSEGNDWSFAKDIQPNTIKFYAGNDFDAPVIIRIKSESFNDADQKAECFLELANQFRNGLLIAEDINKYLVTTTQKKAISALVANRQKKADIIIQFQSLAAVTPRIFQNAYIYRIHQQGDDIERYKKRIPSYHLFSIAMNMIRNKYIKEKNIRYFLYINLLDYKIEGNYTLRDYISSVVEYLISNPSVFNKYLSRAKMSKDSEYIKKSIRKHKITKNEAIQKLAIKIAMDEFILYTNAIN